MKAIDYLVYAFNKKLYKKVEWMLNAFTISEASDSQPYPGKLVPGKTEYSFYNDQLELVKIEDSSTNELFRIDTLVPASKLTNLKDTPETTTLGRVLLNILLIEIPFRGILPFIDKKFSISTIESTIIPLLNPNPKNSAYALDKLYVNDLNTFGRSVMYLSSFSHIFIVATSDKLITPPEGIEEYKAKLLEDPRFKGKLSDPVVFQLFEQELIKYDSEYLNTDPNSKYFGTSEKSRSVIRKQMFLSVGYEQGFKKETKITPVINSLTEGIGVKDLTDVNNAARIATAHRALATASGGYKAKTLARATTDVKLKEKDCRTKLGLRVLVSNANKKTLLGKYINTNNEPLLLTDKNVDSFVGKRVILRNPGYCSTQEGFCHICLGEELASNNGSRISISAMSLGNAIMYSSMSKAHTGVKRLNEFSLEDFW